MLLFALFLLFLILFSACTTEPYSAAEPQLVVEGWVDSNGYPIVFLTTTMTANGPKDQATDISSHLIKWAKVSISDGEKEVILTGKYMKDYMPPYGYTTSEMKGISGRTYRLTVDYPPFHAEATTTIPPIPKVDSISVKPCTDNDTLYEAKVCLSENTMRDDGGYKLFAMRKHKDDYHLSCYMGTYKSALLQLPTRLSVFNVHRSDTKDFSPYFSSSDTLSIKVATVDEEALTFWNDFERNVSLSKSPFLSPNENMRGNVTGALGFWFGYGCSYHLVMPPDILKEKEQMKQ